MKDEDIFIPAEEKLATPEGVRRKRSPQEKKELSYKKDRRNTYGENDKSSRKNIPAKKARTNRRNRRKANEDLSPLSSERTDITSAEAVQDKILGRRETRAEWYGRKYPDTPLGEVLDWKENGYPGNAERERSWEFIQERNKEIPELLAAIDYEWQAGGFFYELQNKTFSAKSAERTLDKLAQIQPYYTKDLEPLCRRIVEEINSGYEYAESEAKELYFLYYELFYSELKRLVQSSSFNFDSRKYEKFYPEGFIESFTLLSKDRFDG